MLAAWTLLGYAMAAIAPALVSRAPRAARHLLPLGPAVVFVWALTVVGAVASGEVPAASHAWLPALGFRLALRLDGLALVFVLLISGIGALVVRYAADYLRDDPGLPRFQAFVLAFMASMLGLVLADDVVALFVFWELTSVTSFFLIGHHHERPEARGAALQALLVTSLGGLALLGGLLLLGIAGGTHALGELALRGAALRESPLLPAAVVLVLAGAFTKSAQVPFSSWLPRAMEAPTPASAYLHAATMVKAGVYLVARLSPALAEAPLWRPALVLFGGATFLLGAVRAFRETHMKRILAQSTVSGLGLLVFLVGIGTPGAHAAAVLFLVGHAAYKGSLFLVAGAVDHEAGTADVERLGGLARSMPVTAAAAGIAALSMAGLPPTLGFAGKEASLEATSAAGALATAVVVIGGGLLLAVALRVGVLPFLGRGRDPSVRAHEAPPGMWSAPLLLTLTGVGAAAWPSFVPLLSRAAAAIAGGPAEVKIVLLPHGGPLLALTAGAIAVGVAAHAGRRLVARVAVGGRPRGYELFLVAVDRSAKAVTGALQTGQLHHYIVVVLASVVALAGWAMLSRGLPPLAPPALDVGVAELGLAILVVLSAIAAVRLRSRLGAIASMGVAGYAVALLFLWFGAPDLAMTQFAIETLTVIVFLLAFHHLPAFRPRSTPRRRLRDALVAGTVGVLMGGLVLAASVASPAEKVSEFFLRESVPGGHGRNVVNVILVDFRALDTLGEITVLGVAATAVFALLKLRPRGGGPT